MEPKSPLYVAVYDVEASDGRLGTIDDASKKTLPGDIVIDTGARHLGRKRLIPSAAVTRVDHVDRKVYLSVTKRDIKHAPDYEKKTKTADGHLYNEKYCLP